MNGWRWWAAAAWALAVMAGVAALWYWWPQTAHPQLWRQVAAWGGMAAAGVSATWAVVSYANMRGRHDPLELLCVVGLAVMALSFMASPSVVWLGLVEGLRAQYVAWALRLAALLILLPYTVLYLMRRRPWQA